MATYLTTYLYRKSSPAVIAQGATGLVTGGGLNAIVDEISRVVQLTVADSPYTMLTTDSVIEITGVVTINLPALSTVLCKRPIFINVGTSGNGTLSRNGSDTFSDGSTSQVVAPGQLTELLASSNWRILL